jgi:hypothetical protein
MNQIRSSRAKPCNRPKGVRHGAPFPLEPLTGATHTARAAVEPQGIPIDHHDRTSAHGSLGWLQNPVLQALRLRSQLSGPNPRRQGAPVHESFTQGRDHSAPPTSRPA